MQWLSLKIPPLDLFTEPHTMFSKRFISPTNSPEQLQLTPLSMYLHLSFLLPHTWQHSCSSITIAAYLLLFSPGHKLLWNLKLTRKISLFGTVSNDIWQIFFITCSDIVTYVVYYGLESVFILLALGLSTIDFWYLDFLGFRVDNNSLGFISILYFPIISKTFTNWTGQLVWGASYRDDLHRLKDTLNTYFETYLAQLP